jgi:hypothetical protein
MPLKRAGRSIGLVVLMLCLATTAAAGPTCENPGGDAVRCGSPGAMPLGWTVSAEQRRIHLARLPPDPTPLQLLGLAGLIASLFALIALMPDFEGWEATDRQPEDGDEKMGH